MALSSLNSFHHHLICQPPPLSLPDLSLSLSPSLQPQGGYLVTRLIKYITENFATEDMASEVEAFFQERQIPGTERTVQQSLETIRLNAAWLLRDQDAIKKYLTELEG